VQRCFPAADSGLVRVFDGLYSEVLLLPSKDKIPSAKKHFFLNVSQNWQETSEKMSKETVALVFVICHSWRAPAPHACANAGGAGEPGIWIWMR